MPKKWIPGITIYRLARGIKREIRFHANGHKRDYTLTDVIVSPELMDASDLGLGERGQSVKVLRVAVVLKLGPGMGGVMDDLRRIVAETHTPEDVVRTIQFIQLPGVTHANLAPLIPHPR